MKIPKSRIIYIAGCITVFLCTFIFSVQEATANSSDPLFKKTSTVVEDTLQTYIKKANSLWNQKKSDLELSFQLLSETAENEATPYYNLASRFYFWSINNASFQREKKTIEDEVNRLLPLVPDSTKKKWKKYLEEEDPQLLREIIGFWRTQDPFNSTQLNERLIEHWQRISYAKEHFNKASDSPYGTDERGTFYVRFGSPNSQSRVHLKLSDVYDPESQERIVFTSSLTNEVEIWTYQIKGKNYFYLFGHRNSMGRYGLRDDILELVNSNSVRVRFRNSFQVRPSILDKITKNALLYALSEELSPYHPFFQNLYLDIKSRLSSSPGNRHSFVQRFSRRNFGLENKTTYKIRGNLALTPTTQTSQKFDNEYFSVRTEIFQFLDEQNKNEYLFTLQPNLQEDFSAEPQLLSNKLYIYDNQWKNFSIVDNLIKIEEEPINNHSFSYPVSQSTIENNIYYSAELIDTTRSNFFILTRINPKTTIIVKSTGKEKVTFPDPLTTSDSLLVSDILLGKSENENDEARIPISPSLDKKFDQNEDVMIYFEAYNIPQEGYSFTYYFEKERWLFGPKKVEDKSEVTILAEDATDRDDQFFSINLNDLDPNSYQLVLEFSPIDPTNTIGTKQKIISFEIVE